MLHPRSRTTGFLAGTVFIAIVAALLAVPAAIAHADPCGMVPPIYTGQGPAIERIGLQKTYVFYRDGVETFVIRPGFTGKVEEFGMLIPFPTVPSIRKVDDHIFTHIANAIDPPEVVVDLRPMPPMAARGGAVRRNSAMPESEGALGVNEARVLHQEAVGMYEVVVLAAGSANALKKWMEDHGYVYPEGMDKPVQDYVNEKWCFVAIKTRVAKKSTADPQPGQREVEPGLPEGASFDGNVQAMGFRFEWPEFVVPMRLSAFNGDDLHNVVYCLTDKPARIRNIPEGLVKRQMSGEELYRNLTQPLPLRVLGGTIDDLRQNQARWTQVQAQRDPKPHNGVAAQLFGSDLLAADTKKLVHPHEEREKALLDISERLMLRGPEIDAAHAEVLKDMRVDGLDEALKLLSGMTLTVIDGDFPREVITNENLHFISYQMPDEENSNQHYRTPGATATAFGGMNEMGWGRRAPLAPGQLEEANWARGGNLYHASVRPIPGGGSLAMRVAQLEARLAALDNQSGGSGSVTIGSAGPIASLQAKVDSLSTKLDSTIQGQRTMIAIAVCVGAVMIAFSVVLGLRGSRAAAAAKQAAKTAAPATGAMLLIAALVVVGLPGHTASAQDRVDPDAVQKLIDQLADRGKAAATVDKLVSMGMPVAPFLIGEAEEGTDIVIRGWCIAALGEIGGKEAEERLTGIYQNTSQSMLVRTWAAAAVVAMKTTVDELAEAANLISQFPALGRPIGMRLVDKLSGDLEGNSLEKLLRASMRIPQLQGALARPIMALGPARLVTCMQKGADNDVRRQAAAYLAALGNQGGQDATDTADSVIAAYTFTAGAKEAAWKGGALFLPGFQWPKDKAKALIHNLLEWHLWLDLNQKQAEQQQINNNLNSINLIYMAGMQWPNSQDTVGWLKAYAAAFGKDDVKKMLEKQGVADNDKYKAALQ